MVFHGKPWFFSGRLGWAEPRYTHYRLNIDVPQTNFSINVRYKILFLQKKKIKIELLNIGPMKSVPAFIVQLRYHRYKWCPQGN